MRHQTFNIRNAENVDGKGWFVAIGTNPTIMKIEGVDQMGFPKLIRSNGTVNSAFFVSSRHLRTPEIGYSAFNALLVGDCVDDNGNVTKPIKLAKIFNENFPKMKYTGTAKYWKAYNKNFN